MKQFTLKSLMLLLLLLIGGGSYAWGESYAITFGNNAGSATPISKTTKAATVIAKGTEYVVAQPFSVTGNCYYGDEKESIRLSKSGNSATLTIALSDAGKVNATSVVVRAKLYNENKPATLACNNQTAQSLTKDYANYTFTLDGSQLSSLVLSSSNYLYVASIEVNYSSAPAANLTSIAVSGTPTKTTYEEGEVFDPTGLVVTATYEDESTEVVTSRVEWTFNPETLTLGTNEVKATATYGEMTASKTVTVTVAEVQKYNVTWNVNGNDYTEGNPTTEVVEGEKVEVLPTAPASIGGLVFMGWTNEAVTSQEAAPAVLFTSAADAPAVTADATYYAVFASQSGSMKWKKVSLANVDEGIYALITPDGHAFNGKIASGHGQATVDAFIFDKSGVATSAPEGTLEVILSAKAGGYTMFNADKGYLYAKEAKSGNLDWDTKESGNWLYKEDQKEDNWLYDSNKAYLRCYKNTFRTYGYGAYDSISFVKKVSDISYSNYTTSAETLPLRAFDGKNHFATFSSDKAVKFVDATVYAVGVNDDRLILTEVESKQVPANTGVLLKSASTEATYSVIGSAPAIENNLLCASVEEGQTTAADGTTEGYSFFKLSYNQAGENEKLGFYWAKENGAPFVSKTGLAYLAVKTADVAAVKGFSLIDMETGISKVSGSAAGNGVIYDLQGRRVEHAVRGLYIVNGRKVMVK